MGHTAQSACGDGARGVMPRCDHCSEPAAVVAPGTVEERNLFLLLREKPMRCWCLRCWQAEYGLRPKELAV